MLLSLTPYLQIMLAMIIVGSSVVAGKLVTESLPIMVVSCVRFAIASIVFIFILLYREKASMPSLKDCRLLILQSFTGVFLFSVFLLYGLKHSGAIEAGLITGTLPAVTAILALILLKDKLNKWQLLGIACTVVGSSMLNILSDQMHAKVPFSLIGGLFIFGAVVGEAIFTIIGKMIGQRVTPLMICTSVTVIAFFLFLPFALWEGLHFDFSKTTLRDWSLVIYFGIVVTVGAFWLFYAGLSKVSATIAGGFMAFIPLSAMLLSIIILKEQIQLIHFIAGFCIILGIILLSVYQNK